VIARTPRPRTALIASTTAFTLVIIGTTVVNVALPEIRRDLGGGVSGLQWVINAYTLMFASLLLTMGALCDLRGARRVMLSGVAVFVAGALVAATAPTLGVLIAGQVVLGTGAAALMPASLALISHAYPDDRRRAHAISIFASASAVSIGLGPVLGGLLIDVIGWRAIFAMDIPLALFVTVLVARGVEETPRRPAAGLDVAGQLAAIVALAAFTFAIIESGAAGWGTATALLALALALCAGTLFLAIERGGAHPMLPLSLFGSRAFSVGAGSGLLVNFGVYGQFFVLSLYLQELRGLSPLETGIVFLVQPLTAAFTALPAGRITARKGPRIPVAIGGLLATVGTLLLLSVQEHSTYALIVVSLALLGAGGGMTIPALTAAVVSGAPRAQVGVAAATFTASRQVGGILGVAVLGAMVSQASFLHGLHLAAAVTAAALAVSGIAGALLIAAAPEQPGLVTADQAAPV
jgi:DHA2 family methylenomycin A resistance protein-like MFS transporter